MTDLAAQWFAKYFRFFFFSFLFERQSCGLTSACSKNEYITWKISWTV